MHLDMYLNAGGPQVPDVHYEDMEEQDLRNVMAYIYGACASAFRDGLDDDMVEILIEWYDEVFRALVGSSDRFRERVLEGFVVPPTGLPNRPKYMKIAREASES